MHFLHVTWYAAWIFDSQTLVSLKQKGIVALRLEFTKK